MASAGQHYRRKAGARKSFLAYHRSVSNLPGPSTQSILSAKHFGDPMEAHRELAKHDRLTRRWWVTNSTARTLRGLPKIRHARIRRAIRNIDYREVALVANVANPPSTDWVALFKKTDQPV